MYTPYRVPVYGCRAFWNKILCVLAESGLVPTCKSLLSKRAPNVIDRTLTRVYTIFTTILHGTHARNGFYRVITTARGNGKV